jgi:hypothetical protein
MVDGPNQLMDGFDKQGWVEAKPCCTNWVWVAGGSFPRRCQNVVANPVLVEADQVQSNRMVVARTRRM